MAANISPTDYYYYCGDDSPKTTLTDWMKNIHDATPIWKLSIPGTHGSMTYKCFNNKYEQFQQWTLDKQLQAGIRFVDVSLHQSPEIEYDHFIGSLLPILTNFIRENPTEFIILHLNDEYPECLEFWKHLEGEMKAEGIFSLANSNSLPILKDIRGHIVLLKPSDYKHWNKINIAGIFNFSNTSYEHRFKVITENIASANGQATNGMENHRMMLSFVNGTGLDSPPAVIAKEMNYKIGQFLQEHSFDMKSVGVVVMDFPGVGIIRDIIKFNKTVTEGATQVRKIHYIFTLPVNYDLRRL